MKLIAFAVVLFLASFAYAAGAPPIDPESADVLVNLLISAIQSGNIALGIAVVVMLLVLTFRKLVLPMFGERWPVLLDKKVIIGATIAASLALTFGTALLAGTPITIGLILTALLGAVGASGIWSIQKNAVDGQPLRVSGTALSAIIGREPGEGFRGPKP